MVTVLVVWVNVSLTTHAILKPPVCLLYECNADFEVGNGSGINCYAPSYTSIRLKSVCLYSFNILATHVDGV